MPSLSGCLIAVRPIYILAECFCSVVPHTEHFFVSLGSCFKNRDGLVGITERGSEEKLCSPLFSTRRPSSKDIEILYYSYTILLKPTWLWQINFWCYVEFILQVFSTDIFASMFIGDIDLNFFMWYLSTYMTRVILAFKSKFRSLPSYYILLQNLSCISIGSTLKFW